MQQKKKKIGSNSSNFIQSQQRLKNVDKHRAARNRETV